MNASASWPEAEQARNRVLEIQTKLHRWAVTLRSHGTLWRAGCVVTRTSGGGRAGETHITRVAQGAPVRPYYVKAGLEKDKAALLVVIGAMSDGRKQVLAIRSGHRESTESWLKVLRDLRDRGLCAPVLLMADGGLPIWSAAEQVWPEAAQQRCWNHKIINVLDDLPKRVQGKARALLTQIPVAETRKEAETRRDTFAARYRERYPAAVATLERDWQRMVTFYDFPEQHWKHLRTTNPVESPFASVRLRTNAGKRYKRVQGATALIWRVLMVAEKRFRKLNAPELLADVFAGDQYQDGKPIQREDASSKEGFKKKAA